MKKCHTPFWLQATSDQNSIPLPCGKCPYCKKRRVASWEFRLLKEEERSSSSHFITLTYDSRHVPINSKKQLTLSSGKGSDLQLFFKRLRKLQTAKIKYYAVGEYGTTNNRPHYHIIMFNLANINNLARAWTAKERSSENISQIGNVHVGTVSGNSIAYTCKYIAKQGRIPMFKGDLRKPEFSVMSNGLGKNYLTKEMIKWHQADLTRMYVVLKGGVKIAMPKYYRNFIFDEDEREKQRNLINKITEQEQIKLRQHYEKLYKNTNLTFEQYLETLKRGEYEQYYSSLNQKRQ